MKKVLDIEKIKKSPILQDPWQHKIIEDFFPDHIFEKIREVAKSLSDQVIDSEKTYPMWLNEALNRGADPSIIDVIIEAADNILDNIPYLLEDFTDKQFSSQGYFAMPKFGISGKNFKYPIHTESSHKVILFVIYLYPDNDVGTRLYRENDEKSFTKAIPWKPNTAFMTAITGDNDKTWHNWSGSGNPTRITLNIFCEKLEQLENSVIRSGRSNTDSMDDLLWVYEQFARGHLTSNKV